MSEPTLEIFHGETLTNRLITFAAATRPAFLGASVLPVLVAVALAWRQSGVPQVELSLLIVLNIVLIHAGANVLNDYFDAGNGTDDMNEGRLFPFSGGSRFIQNGVLSRGKVLRLGTALMTAGAALGVFMSVLSGPLLLAIGLLGGLTAIFYSAPPCLACRGLGDLAIAACFGLLPVIGTEYILLGTIHMAAWWLGAVIGCFVAAILWVNSIPDIDADRAAGKLTLPARLGKRYAPYGLMLLFGLGFALVALGPLPSACRFALLALVPAAMAVQALRRGRLLPAIPLTLLTHAGVCLLLLIGCVTVFE